MSTERKPRPLLVSIPHAGLEIPEEVASVVALSQQELLGYTDLYTDQIFNIDNVHLLTNPISRVIVDVNRAPDDISREYEQAAEGVIVHTTWDGRSVYQKEPSQDIADTLIRKYHDSYHEQIDKLMPEVQFLIDGHSYLPVGPKLKPDSGIERPDINLGNMNYSTCTREHTVFFREFFEKRGYSVRVNFPYTGKYILGHHCHRRRIPPFLVPGMQIEINQGLYLKPDSFEAIPERVEEFHELFDKLASAFCERFVKEEGDDTPLFCYNNAMRLVVEVHRPLSLLALVTVTVGFVVWTVNTVEPPPARDTYAASAGGDEEPVQQDILNAEDAVRRRRQEISVMERKEEILRFQLRELESVQKKLDARGDETLSAELEQSREHLLALLKDKRAAENQLRTSLQQVWEAEARGGRISASLTGPVATLGWPIEPAAGISAHFKDTGYEQHFGIPHYAIDIPALQGTTIRAPADGVVETVADNGTGYSYLIIKHQGVATLYGHVSTFLVDEGQQVKLGEPIALSGGQPGTRGAGALTTGPHLHFETIVDGERVDPLTLLPKHPSVQ